MSISLLLTAALLALVASPHCVGMCGCGLAQRWLAGGAYQGRYFLLARLLSYAAAGSVAGGASSLLATWANQSVQFFGVLHWVLMALVTFSAVFMVSRARPITTQQTVSAANLVVGRVALSAGGGRGSRGALAGALWWAVPCGVLYSAFALAYLAGNWQQGVAVMLVFGLFSTLGLGLSSQFQLVLRRYFSEAAVYRCNGLLVLLSIVLVLARELGWVATPQVLESLGFCI